MISPTNTDEVLSWLLLQQRAADRSKRSEKKLALLTDTELLLIAARIVHLCNEVQVVSSKLGRPRFRVVTGKRKPSAVYDWKTKVKLPAITTWYAIARNVLKQVLKHGMAYLNMVNLAICAGPVSDQYELVHIDIDNKAELAGLAGQFKDLLWQAIGETQTTRTGSGGYHCEVLVPAGSNLKNSNSTIVPRVDVICNPVNYVVAPGGRYDAGKTYDAVNDVPLVVVDPAALPGILVSIFNQLTGQSLSETEAADRWLPAATTTKESVVKKRSTVSAKSKAIFNNPDKFITVGNRAHFLRHVTAKACGANPHITSAALRVIVDQANEERCVPPLEPNEVLAIVEDYCSYRSKNQHKSFSTVTVSSAVKTALSKTKAAIASTEATTDRNRMITHAQAYQLVQATLEGLAGTTFRASIPDALKNELFRGVASTRLTVDGKKVRFYNLSSLSLSNNLHILLPSLSSNLPLREEERAASVCWSEGAIEETLVQTEDKTQWLTFNQIRDIIQTRTGKPVNDKTLSTQLKAAGFTLKKTTTSRLWNCMADTTPSQNIPSELLYASAEEANTSDASVPITSEQASPEPPVEAERHIETEEQELERMFPDVHKRMIERGKRHMARKARTQHT